MSQEFRVLGPPGTGKTTYLADQMNKAANKYGSDRVTVCSYTRAAAQEMRSREVPIPPENAGTLHALCFRAMDRPVVANPKDWKAYLEANHRNRMNSWAISGGKVDLDEPSWEAIEGTVGDDLIAYIDVMRNQQIPKEKWTRPAQEFSKVWEEFKDETDCVDFTDMIEWALRVAITAPGRPKAFFVDEAQDLSRLQLALVNKWGAEADSFVVALDDDQSIYGWAGADPKWFIDHPVPDDHRRVLTQSYRIPRAVHEGASNWINQVRFREPKEYKPRDAEGYVELDLSTYKRPYAAIDDIEEYLDRTDKTIMILASCSYMIDPIKHELRDRGIPFHNPYRVRRGDWNPLGSKNGTRAADRLLAFVKPFGANAAMWTRDDVAAWGSALRADGVWKRGAKKQVTALEGDELVDWDLLGEFLEPAAMDPIYEGRLSWFVAHTTSEMGARMSYPVEVLKKRGADALSAAPRVVIGTVHSVKGGEADRVYLLPDISRLGNDEWNSEGGRDSVIRLFYVGLTRAKEGVIICQQETERAVPIGELT